MMRKLLGWIFHPLLLLTLGLIALSALIALGGPLLAFDTWRPLDSLTARTGTIVALWLLALLIVIGKRWAAGRTNAQVVDQLARPAPSSAGPADANLKAIDTGFEKALRTLRAARFGSASAGLVSRYSKRYLYELPWYVIIGAPGAGKTTALVASGLEFPLAAQTGKAPKLRGVGGTRNCEWWFTKQAVLIDTAGRYSTQDSHPASDAREWSGFLTLLKTSRPRQPLNGVLVAVSVPDLLKSTAQERAEHAAKLRSRVQELHQQLAMRFPIYLLVTMCDLLAGFTDYLGDADRDTRAEPWGFTFALDARLRCDLGAFEQEFDALLARLNAGLVDRLQPERDVQRRARIYSFPQQFEGLRTVLREFIDAVFAPSQFEAEPMLRGVYFVSGTQEGSPIDRAIGRAERAFGLEGTLAPAHTGSTKSYFLTRLLSDLVFSESALAGIDVKWERRRIALACAGYATVALLLVGGGVAWSTSYLNNLALIERVDQRVNDVSQLLAGIPKAASADPLPLLPALEATEQLASASNTPQWSESLGLYQGRKLDAASQLAYRGLLAQMLLPRLALRLQQQLEGADANAEGLYEALKVYVMLVDPTHFDAGAIKRYLRADWDANLPRSVSVEQRAQLEHHLNALFYDGVTVSPLSEDRALLERARARAAATALPERIYRRLQRLEIGTQIAPFTIAGAAGPNAALVWRRASGAPLTRGVPGLYTHDGYYKAFNSQLQRVGKQLADEEPWVLGTSGGAQAVMQFERAGTEVRRLYLNDYARLWTEFIADLRMQPTTGGAALQMARVLSAPDNPLVPLLRSIVHQTTLTAKPEPGAKAAPAVEPDDLSRLFKKVLPGAGASAAAAPTPGRSLESIVDDKFVALRQLMTAQGGGPAPIDTTIALIGEIYEMLNSAKIANEAGSKPPASSVLGKVKADAPRLPEPVRSMVENLAANGKRESSAVWIWTLASKLNATLGDLCRQALTARYPFVRGSPRDVPLEDFTRLFAPGGLYDAFFQQNLLDDVDQSARPWRFKEPGVAAPGLLDQFQRAAAIRDTYFRGGAFGLRLEMKPVEMDAGITQFILDVDGALVRYAHGPQIPAPIQWPGPGGSRQVRVALQPPSASGDSGSLDEGPWALMRLFDRLQIEAGNVPERFRATFSIEGRRAVFDVTSSSVLNPFRLGDLQGFTCPAKG